MKATDCFNDYFSLMEERPELFAESDAFPIVTDRRRLEAYQREHHVQIGVVYKSPYYTVIVDLIEKEGRLFTYDRMVTTSSGIGVICVPVMEGKILLVKQSRHAIRSQQICFPRGFGEDGISPEENAKKELREEIGAEAKECVFLGSVFADSGIIGTECHIYLCRIDRFNPAAFSEEITEAFLADLTDLDDLIKNRRITDGFTLSAISFLKANPELLK